MKKILGMILLLVFVFAACGLAFASDNSTGNNGELNILYWTPKVNMTNTGETWPGWIIRGSVFSGNAYKFGIEYAAARKSINAGTPAGAPGWTGRLQNFKFHAKYAPWKTSTYDFGIGLFYTSQSIDSLTGTNGNYVVANGTASGIGIGIDGRFNLAEKVAFYGLVDYAPSLKTSMAGQSKSFADTDFEFGLGFKVTQPLEVKIGYRINTYTKDVDYKASGLFYGVNFRF